MGATVSGVDVVGKRHDIVFEPIVILECGLDPDIAFFTTYMDGFMQRVLILVEVLNEGDDSTFVFKTMFLVMTLVAYGNFNPLIEKREFS